MKARWCHSLTTFSLGPGLTVVTVFGGTDKPPIGSAETQPKLADTTLLQFSKCTSANTCTVQVSVCRRLASFPGRFCRGKEKNGLDTTAGTCTSFP